MRFGLPLMVLTSLSLHAIAVLIWMIAAGHSSKFAFNSSTEFGPAIILTKAIAPLPNPPSSPDQSTPRPTPHPSIPSPDTAKTSPHFAKAVDPESILSPGGAPHLDGGVVFVLDISGSMYEAYPGGNRLTVARKLLDRQIASHPNGTPFAVTLYGESTRRSGPLVAATDATRDAAVRYLAEDFDCGGGTNLPAGLDVAEDLHPDSVIVVTDGDLNITEKKLISEAHRILGRPGPHLSVIGIAPRPKTGDEELLRDLVREQAGTYQPVGQQ